MKLIENGKTVNIINGANVNVYPKDACMMYRLNSSAYEICLDPYVGFLALADIKDAEDNAMTIDQLKNIFKRNVEIAYSTIPIEAGTAILKPKATEVPIMNNPSLVALDFDAVQVLQNYSDEIAGSIASVWLHIMQGTSVLLSVNAGAPTKGQLNYTVSGLTEQTKYKIVPVLELSDGKFVTDCVPSEVTTPEDTEKPVASTLEAPGASYMGDTAPEIVGKTITYKGEIPWSNANPEIGRVDGNYVAMFIKTDPSNLTKFPDMKVQYDGQNKWDKSVFAGDEQHPNTLLLWIKVKSVEDAHTVTLVWDAKHTEEFYLNIADDATFATGPDSPYDEGESKKTDPE